MSKVITRFPPSPTGFLHIGGVRTALFNYLFAAHNGGKMVLRFEDTDKERSKPEFEQDILDAINWAGIPYELAATPRQSEKTELYKSYVHKLLETGAAYEAEESEGTPGKKVVRFKNPNSTITFMDAVRGEVTFDTTDLKDFVIARTTDEPLYHLAVVIDDHDMGITHVIRGEEHISNTPRQILILEALGFARPQYAHIPLILAPDKSKLSKRHGAVSSNEYKALGFIPEALVNYLALLGWNPGGDRELFTLAELAEMFTLERVHKAGAVFDIHKFLWFNHEHLKRLSDEEYKKRLEDFCGTQVDSRLIPLLKARAQTLKEAATALTSEFGFLNTVFYEKGLLNNQGKIAPEVASNHLKALHALLLPLPDEAFTAAQLKDIIWPYATTQGRGDVLWPMRTALSGAEKSPDPFTVAALLGKEESLSRIARAAESL